MMLFLLFALCASESLESGSGHLIIHKTLNCLDCDVFGVGHNVTVTIHANNMGDGSAYDVKVNDTVPKKFTVVEGNPQGSIGEVLSGETETYSYKIVTDQTQLIVRVEAAQLTYKRTEEGE